MRTEIQAPVQQCFISTGACYLIEVNNCIIFPENDTLRDLVLSIVPLESTIFIVLLTANMASQNDKF